jgi:hypothetical protein
VRDVGEERAIVGEKEQRSGAPQPTICEGGVFASVAEQRKGEEEDSSSTNSSCSPRLVIFLLVRYGLSTWNHSEFGICLNFYFFS